MPRGPYDVSIYLTMRFLGDKLSERQFFHGGISQYRRVRRLATPFYHG